MIKNNKGITMIALVITIIILLILISITIRSSSPLVEEAKLEDVRTTMLLIQAKWKVEREKAKFDGTSMFPTDQIVQQSNIDDGTYAEAKKWQLIASYEVTPNESWAVDTTITYYKLDQDRLNDMGLQEVNAEDGYIVNYNNNDVIFEKGFWYEEKTYYKLSEINGLYE